MAIWWGKCLCTVSWKTHCIHIYFCLPILRVTLKMHGGPVWCTGFFRVWFKTHSDILCLFYINTVGLNPFVHMMTNPFSLDWPWHHTEKQLSCTNMDMLWTRLCSGNTVDLYEYMGDAKHKSTWWVSKLVKVEVKLWIIMSKEQNGGCIKSVFTFQFYIDN
jgi:hypothetical protein